MSLDTQHTFTQEQANAMYAFIDTYIFTEMKMYHATRLFVDDMSDWEVGYGIPAGAIMNLRADLYTVDMQAIASTPAAPADSVIVAIQAMIARGELPYCPIHGEEMVQRIDGSWGCTECDWQAQKPVHELYPASQPAQEAGLRYIPKKHPTHKTRYCVWDTETNEDLFVPGEFVLWTMLPRVKRYCERLNAAAALNADTGEPTTWYTAEYNKRTGTFMVRETEAVEPSGYDNAQSAQDECDRLNASEQGGDNS